MQLFNTKTLKIAKKGIKKKSCAFYIKVQRYRFLIVA